MTRNLVEGTVVPSHYVTPDRFLRLSQVMEMVAFGKSHIYAMISSSQFPAPRKPGGSASRWSENEILAWLASFNPAGAN